MHRRVSIASWLLDADLKGRALGASKSTSEEGFSSRPPHRASVPEVNHGETDMGDKGSKDKGKREQQKKAQLSQKEKRKLKKEKKNK